MLYAYVCEHCGERKELLRPVAERDSLVFCASLFHDNPMRREISTPTVHYKGAGWTRTPSIMNDPIAAGHPQQRENWGVASKKDFGNPDVDAPYKKVVNEHTSADGEVD